MTYPDPGPAHYPVAPFGGQPVYDQGTSQPFTTGEGFYSLDPSASTPPTGPMDQPAPPTSGFPGRPIGHPVAEPPRRRGLAVPLLAAFLALTIILGGIFVGLWVDKSNKLDASETRSNQHQAAIDQADRDLGQTRTSLTAKADELTKVQQDLRGAETEKAELKRQRDVLGSCLKLLLEALEAIDAGDKTTTQNKINEMKQPCNEAEAMLGL